MGSRAVMIVCRDEESAIERFGLAPRSGIGVCYTRTGETARLLAAFRNRANIIANWIHNNGTHVVNGIPQDQGLYLSGVRDGVIANNVIDHNLGFGIQLYPRPTRTLVTCNTIIANGATPNALASGIIVGGDETADNTIVNNIVAWNGDAGIRSHQTRYRNRARNPAG